MEHSEWIAARRKGITATDAAAILGASPWRTPAMVRAEKLGLERAPAEETVAMRLGKRLEPAILAEYAEATGRDVTPNGLAIATSPKWPLLRATPDAYVQDRDRGLGLLEAKATSVRRWEPSPPAGYLIQVQVQLACTELSWADLAALHASTGFAIYPQTALPDEIEQMYAILDRWWERHVVQGDECQAAAADLPALQSISPVAGKRILLPPYAREIVARWEAAKESARLADVQRKAAQAQILQLLGDASEGEVPGLTALVRRSKALVPERMVGAYERNELRLVRKGDK